MSLEQQPANHIINERFYLKESLCNKLKNKTPSFGFGGFGEATYYRTYSRLKNDGTQEHWSDTVIRVINGVISIRKEHYISNRLEWKEEYWQKFAHKLAVTMFDMKWLPPGRGLWVMGTEYVYERGGAALNNCGAVDTTDLSASADWAMDMLMCGVGVGFNTSWEGKGVNQPNKSRAIKFTVPDSREGWVASVRLLIESYTKGGSWFSFDYSKIRAAGSPIKGFGGTASGYRPLKELHNRIEEYLDRFCSKETDTTRTVADIFNAIGACVVAGNVRRSAEISLGSVDDETFLDLKNYEKNPERRDIGWMSNNTVVLTKSKEFQKLPKIAKRIQDNGEPGIMNLINVQKYGRYGEQKEDKAWLANPCSEIPLESYELCNLAEVFSARCINEDEFYEALEYATFYASTVALLPTHRTETNTIVVRNRRIGVSLSGVADMLDEFGAAELTRRLRKGYKIVKKTNTKLAAQAGVPASVRVTTVKPSGTISQLVGVSSGMHFPTFQYAIRRMRVGTDSAICDVLKKSKIPHEDDTYSQNTTVFEFPIDQGKTRKATSVSAWEQFSLLSMLQREWSDNMVSCTVYFDPKTEGSQIEHMLALFAPIIKSVSLLPHSDAGAYKQMPYEGITKEEYEKRLNSIPNINWSEFGGSNGIQSKLCTNDECEII
ncbi:MAG: fused protease/ribonucleoside-triphosphate reductase [Campylobacterota bacterium]|nr:fused protease/ribonucleoside-triphosphate reductase [Campylobacterota bacterium]